MSDRIIIFTLKSCPYCSELKEKLDKEGIEYEEYDADVHEDTYYKLAEKADKEAVPMIIVNKSLFVPEVSFDNIDKAVEMVKAKISGG